MTLEIGKITTKKSSIYILGIILLVSCKNSRNQTINVDTATKTINLTDSSRVKLIGSLDTIIKSNSSPDDVTISAKFINQGKNENGDSYITLKTKNDSLIVLTDPMLFQEEEIAKFKKDDNNITVTYSASSKKVKFIAAGFEPQK